MAIATERSKIKSFSIGAKRVSIGSVGVVFLVLGACEQNDRLFEFMPTMIEIDNPVEPDKTLYVQRSEVTVEEWNRCTDDGGCTERLHLREGLVEKDYPATGLNSLDVAEYIKWISKKTGHPYRLPTSDEWEGFAREVLPREPEPLFDQPELDWASAYITLPNKSRKLRPARSFSKTSSGIGDLDGNVWEWTSTCYRGSGAEYTNAPCPAYFVGGEHIAAIPIFVRDPARGGCAVGSPPAHLGLRLVSDKGLKTG